MNENVSNQRMCLCLSGGGFRATLFHLGAIRRLNEFGMLSQMGAISSVSGGSILNGVIATRWPDLSINSDGVITNFDKEIANPVRTFCGTDIRTPLLLLTRLNPLNWLSLLRDYFSISANYLSKSYSPLYQHKSMSDLLQPDTNVPRFVFCTTNLRTGACWHIHGGPEGRMGDFYTGYCNAGYVKVSDAVAASSAFTPGFSSLRLPSIRPDEYTRIDPWGKARTISSKRENEYQQNKRMGPLLTDGGVYDNLGVEPVWGRYSLLVSDAGAPFASVTSSRQFILSRLIRAANISLEQAGAIRKRWMVNEFINGRQQGVLFAINTMIEDFNLPNAKGYALTVRPYLSRIRTDLNSFSKGEIACLENHGYSLTNAAVRSRIAGLCPNVGAPFEWPHQDWCDESKVVKALIESDRRYLLKDICKLVVRRNHT